METQLAGQRSIDKVAGIGGTHLEKDAQLVEYKCVEFVEELLYGHLLKRS